MTVKKITIINKQKEENVIKVSTCQYSTVLTNDDKEDDDKEGDDKKDEDKEDDDVHQ